MDDRPSNIVSTNRRVREDRRFVAGRGNFVADIKRDGMLHVAIVPSRASGGAHRVDRRRGGARRCPACTTC